MDSLLTHILGRFFLFIASFLCKKYDFINIVNLSCDILTDYNFSIMYANKKVLILI